MLVLSFFFYSTDKNFTLYPAKAGLCLQSEAPKENLGSLEFAVILLITQ